MLNGLSLFSGIGGIDLALSEWVKPVVYCEIEPYAAAVLFSRMADGSLPTAPIFPDIRELTAAILPSIDIVYGGFPCQDISVAGCGRGLAGERSGLFFEIMRLVDGVKPRWIFLENVPAITTRGGLQVTAEIASRGYDCRWQVISAAEVGAKHLRKRWWLLANTKRNRRRPDSTRHGLSTESTKLQQENGEARSDNFETIRADVAHANGSQCSRLSRGASAQKPIPRVYRWWATEPDVGRVANGVQHRVDRIKCLGNAVVPQCAKEAFERLMGVT